MGIQELAAAFTARDWEEQREHLVGGLIHFIPAATDPQTVDPRELGASGGAKAPVVAWQERLWWRDEENVDEHDEITVITLLDGVNYVTSDIEFPPAVESRSVTAEPDPEDEVEEDRPQYGQAWRVPEGATGDEWPDHENEVAMWTARGWRFRPGNIGDLHYIKDEEGYEHFGADEAWVDGIGAFAVQAASIHPDDLLIRFWQFENQTTTSPPGTGPAGETYIIGAGASGDWSGHDGKIAWRPATDAEFTILTPAVGETGYDKNLAIPVRWTGSAWVSNLGGVISVGFAQTEGSGSTSSVGTGNYSWNDATPPDTAKLHLRDDASLSRTARAGLSALRFHYQCRFTTDTPQYVTVALLRGSEANAVDWARVYIGNASGGFALTFIVPTPDTSAHTYKVAIFPSSASTNSIGRRKFTVEEIG